MTYIQTVPPDQAEGALKEIYDEDMQNLGYIPGYHAVMSLRPDVIRAWGSFIGAIRSKLRLRRYELATMAAARAMRCRY